MTGLACAGAGVCSGTRVNGNDIIIGKTTPLTVTDGSISRLSKRDSSTSLRRAENGIIDRVLFTTNEAGFKFCKVRVRNVRIPQIGDKFRCAVHPAISIRTPPRSCQAGLPPYRVLVYSVRACAWPATALVTGRRARSG